MTPHHQLDSAPGDPRRCLHYSEEVARQTAALYALGTLGAEELDVFDAHLGEGCASCAEEVRDSLEALAEVARGSAREAPSAELRARMRERLISRIATPALSHPQPWKAWAEQTAPTAPGLRIVRCGEEGFEPTGLPGVAAKPLLVDAKSRYVTMLVRMEPGASYPSHRHAGQEQCYVLEGDLHLGERPGDETLAAGDYQCALAESRHGVQWTRNGCLLLIVSSQDDELVP